MNKPRDGVVAPSPVLIVDASTDSRSLRRTLGATAWFVLEELVVRAVAVEGELRVQVPTRELAVTLGLNKDTVTKALARLRVNNTITSMKRGGSVGASAFSIHLPSRLTTHRSSANAPAEATSPAAPSPVAQGATRRRRGRGRRALDGTAEQLSLLE